MPRKPPATKAEKAPKTGGSLVIVESPTKARTISRFLSKDFTVLASNGHVRDLPNNASEIPAKLKKEAWSRLGVNVENDFSPLWVIPRSKKPQVKLIKDSLKRATTLYLATDEDREGESISWHLSEILKPKIPVKRLVFHEITEEAIRAALESPREIDTNLVSAQEARRIVDRLYGYEVSPILWKKMRPKLSAGRVQSVAVKLLVERERERIKFHSADYWDLKALFEKTASNGTASKFEAELERIGDKRAAVGKDFDPQSGKLKNPADVALIDAQQSAKLKLELEGVTPIVSDVEEKAFSSSPPAPFVTSTLQQEANRKLRLSARRTMQIAQVLYENGFITYMRTDSTTLSSQAITAARTLIERDFGADYLPQNPRIYKSSVKNAQEAHEAVRPAGERFASPSDVLKQLGPEASKLYELIWQRTVASQMKNSKGTNVVAFIRCGETVFRATGKTIEFPGFLRAYVEGSDDPDADLAERERFLPPLTPGEELELASLEERKHVTQPPGRYTEGSLIRRLEQLGIGRPSTWASVVDLVLSRDYAFRRGNALVPTFTAMAVVGLLEKHFSHLVDYDFTARFEDHLDAIARGEADNKSYLREFYFGGEYQGLHPLVENGISEIDARTVCSLPLGKDENGNTVEVRIGRYGPFLSAGDVSAKLLDTMPPDELTLDSATEILLQASKGPELLGKHPETGEEIYLKQGPYGPYLQQGENPEDRSKPKMCSLLPNTKAEDVNIDYALKLLSLPKSIGEHPEDGQAVVLSNGRFGPYLKWNAETRSIPLDEFSPLELTLDQAVEILKRPKRGGRSSKPKVLKELGKHPASEKSICMKSGRYGPYVTDGELNASIPKGREPESITLDEAIGLLEQRASRVSEGKTKRKKKTSKGTKRSRKKQ